MRSDAFQYVFLLAAAFFIGLLAFGFVSPVAAVSKNGFELDGASINASQVFSGGPPRDGIPAIDKPVFESVIDADWLQDDDLVLAISVGDQHRAYPLRILVWHEIVNDTLAGQPIVVTFCPLCGTGMVFDRNTEFGVLDFGVSGLLYQSDVLMYDRQTESLWSQLAMRAVSGKANRTTMRWLPVEHISWAAWRDQHPEGEVLSRQTGQQRDYSLNPYGGYEAGGKPMFAVPEHRDDLPKMQRVLGVVIDGQAKAWQLDALGEQPVTQQLGGVTLKVSYDARSQRPLVVDGEGKVLPSVIVFWFAWQAFYPQTQLCSESSG